jgi:energy-coupling factor transporter ATP-binding protein EcfA2
MTGELLPLVGTVRPHAHLRFSKFSQHFIDVLDLEMSPIDYFMKLWVDLTREDARKFLGRFGVSGSVQTTIMGHLSDGQKSRVVLAKMAKETPHLLLLDEPTNHLDMESIDSLAKAINNFSGGMVLVSHDMRLISQVAKEIWICDNKTVSRYLGEISDFKMHLRRQMQSSNLIDGFDGKVVAPLPIAPLAARALGTSVKAPTVAPSVSSHAASIASIHTNTQATDESLLIQARLELAELAILKQRARQADELSTVVHGSKDDGSDASKCDEKAIQKAKKKAERDAQAALEIREEEERRLRREQKLKDIEEAKIFREEQARLRALATAEKAEKEVSFNIFM